MKEKILISLLAIALISGCSGISIPGVPGLTPGTTVSGGRGLEITSFTAEPNALYNGSTVRITMEVQNLGGATASQSSSFAYLTGSNINVASGTNNYWHRLSGDTNSTDCMGFGTDMKPADVVKGTPGSTKLLKWSLRAPDIDKGQTRNDQFIGRVYTDYETGVNGNIWIYTETEADAAKASGRALNSATFTSTSGPVSVDVSLSPDPVVLYSGDNTFSLNIKITNIATGTIYKPNRPTSCSNMALSVDDLNKVNVQVNVPSELTASQDCSVNPQELVAGKPTTIFCTITINTPSSITTFKSFPIDIKVTYGYFTEKTASVTVQGK